MNALQNYTQIKDFRNKIKENIKSR